MKLSNPKEVLFKNIDEDIIIYKGLLWLVIKKREVSKNVFANVISIEYGIFHLINDYEKVKIF